MKRNVIIIFLLVISFIGCNHKDEMPYNNRVVIDAFHNRPVRVIFDGVKSEWSDGDKLDVVIDGINGIHRFNYNSGNSFVCENLTLPHTQNNICAFYGVDAGNIDGQSMTASFNLSSVSQEQNVQTPTSHIAKYDVLYGKAEGVDKDNISILMNHTIAVVKLNIENALSDVANIKSITLTAPESVILAGSYDLNAASGEILHNASGNDSNVVSVSLSDDIELANGGRYTVWAAVAPFILKVGDKLNIDIVTDDNKIYRCEKVVDLSDLNFIAGSIMSTQIVLGNDATLVTSPKDEEINIEMNFDEGGILPDNFPTSVDNGVTSGTYRICGYDFVFKSPVVFYSNKQETSYRIRFLSGINSGNSATIKLPKIEGYKLSEVKMASTTANKNNYRDYRFSVVNSNGVVIEGGDEKILSGNPEIYKLDNTKGIDCFVRISHNKGIDKHVDLSYLSLKYISE